MPRFASKLLNRTEVAEGTMAFALERPAGFDFVAGQYQTLTLPDPLYNDEKGNVRTFSVASPPQETGHLLVATRMTGSALKRSLADAPLGTPLQIFGPAGSFTLSASGGRPVVFVAGGIGITPFRSMVLDAASRRLSHSITLIYANRTPEGAAFHAEFARLAKEYAGLKYVPTMSQAEASRQSWTGERRTVDVAFLRDHVDDLSGSTFYVAGPPGLVAAVTQAVLAAGVDPGRVIAEEFSGYEARPRQAQPQSATVGPRYVKVASASAVKPGRMLAVQANGRPIVLCNVDGALYAVADECPHRSAMLSEGDLAGKELTCPMHGAIFDVTTGAVLAGPAEEAVASFPVRVNGDDVEVAA